MSFNFVQNSLLLVLKNLGTGIDLSRFTKSLKPRSGSISWILNQLIGIRYIKIGSSKVRMRIRKDKSDGNSAHLNLINCRFCICIKGRLFLCWGQCPQREATREKRRRKLCRVTRSRCGRTTTSPPSPSTSRNFPAAPSTGRNGSSGSGSDGS